MPVGGVNGLAIILHFTARSNPRLISTKRHLATYYGENSPSSLSFRIIFLFLKKREDNKIILNVLSSM